MAGEREVWASQLKLLPLRPQPGLAVEDGWIIVCVDLEVSHAQPLIRCICCTAEAHVFVSDPAEHMEKTAALIVILVERSCCVHHEKCIGFFFEYILHFRGSSYLASQNSMMPFAPLCV